MVDATGRRLTAETDLAPPSAYAGGPEPAYGVKVHPRMAVGRAAFRARVGVLCAGRMLGERTPWTAFDVRAD